MLWLQESPSYFRFRNGTIRLDEPTYGTVIGHKLNVQTGMFEPASSDDVDAVLRSDADLDFSALNEEQFVKETEEARSTYLRGSGPVFDLYRQVDEIFDEAERQRRRISPEERNAVNGLYRAAFQLWEDEFARRAAGEQPTFHYSWVGDTH